MFCVAHDVSERKQAEEKIKQLNENLEKRSAELELANKELEAFSYSVSHDLRAPLRAIDGFSRILLEDYAGKLDDEGLRYLNVVCKNTKQMGQLIDDLLAFSRLSRKGVEKSKVDMNKLATSIVEELQSFEDGRSFDLTLHPMPAAQGDGAMIRQVLVNLISNALKFTRHKAEAKIEIGANGAGRAPVYYVKDNGAGFDMQYADKLFGVFQRLHSAEEFEGTGVGLAIVQRIIQRHGGRVWTEAKPGEGAAFYFTITGDGENQDGDEHQRSGDTFS
jgi:light-regulated signal transduction histidine kinase (bacteriophytochrome)